MISAPLKRRAFTLVELLIALAIAGLVMAGACVLMFNTSMALRYFDEGEPFDVHVNGVEKFLTYSLRNSVFPDDLEADATGGDPVQSGSGVTWGLPPESFLNDKKKLCFAVLDDRPFFIARRGFSPEKIAWLEFRGRDGLYIVWKFVKNENYYDYDEAAIYESLVSQHVTRLEYVFIDSTGNWSYETDSENKPAGVTDGALPDFISVTFERGEEKHVRLVALKQVVDPLFEPSDSSTPTINRRSGGGGQPPAGGGE